MFNSSYRKGTRGNTEQKEMINRKECGSISGKNDQKAEDTSDTRKSNGEITRHLQKAQRQTKEFCET